MENQFTVDIMLARYRKARQTEAKFHFSKGKHIVSYPINNKGEVSFTAVIKIILILVNHGE